VICSEESEALGEELIGTAPEERLVLVVEQAGPWGRDATERLPAELLERAAQAGARIQVVRRQTTRYECDRPAVWLARVGETLERFDVDDLREVTVEPGSGTPDPDPLVLVCTHSTRDPCCARRGLPLHRALARFEPWHSSHLGGHRFAGTLAVLPAGVWLGRVPPERADAVVGDVLAGRLPLDHLRGIAGRPAAVQAAELHVRRALGATALDAVSGALDGERVRLRTPLGEIDATARLEPTGRVRPLSCGEGAKTEDPGRWSVAVPTLEP
jgi:(2Fe-2S) ferredoxin